jgi:thiol-disulfide isomerase/thioredoxin
MIKYFFFTLILLFVFEINGDNSNTTYALENAYKQQKDGNKKAPDFTLKDTDGNEVTLSDYKGKIIILDFWATWCGPCRMSIPDLISIQSKYKDDLIIIGISLDDGRTQGNVKPFMNSVGINYPVVFGTMDVVNDYGNIYAIPTSFIIDQSGNIVNSHIGLVPKENIEGEIDLLLGKT